MSAPTVEIVDDTILVRQPPLYLPLTTDEARALSVRLDDACDEMELAEAVSGE